MGTVNKIKINGVSHDLRDADAQSKISDLASKVGTLSDLQTTAKNNLVSAINEVKQSGSGSASVDEFNEIVEAMVDTPTEQTIKSRTTANGAVIKDGMAFVSKVKGNTLKLRNMYNYSTTITPMSGVSVVVTNGYAQFSGTSTDSGNSVFLGWTDFTATSGHKYYVWSDINLPNGDYFIDQYNAVLTSLKNTIFTASKNYLIPQLKIANSGVDYTNVKGRLAIFDLTTMFGAGNEPTTTTEFANRLGYSSINDVPYIPYTATPTLVSFNASGIKSVGRNLWDEEWELGGLNSSTGTNTASSSDIRSKNYIPVSPNTSYYIKSSVNYSCLIMCYDINKDSLGSCLYATSNKTFTTKDNTAYIKFRVICNPYVNDIIISKGTTPTEYIPYQKDTFSLPTITDIEDTSGNKVFPSGLQSNGSTYDEIDLVSGKAIKRIANDNSVLETPIEYTISKSKAYYKVQRNGTESIVASGDTAPLVAMIGYQSPSANEVLSEIDTTLNS